MNEQQRKAFLALSETLTGVKSDSSGASPPPDETTPGEKNRAKPGDLSPRNSPVDLAAIYFGVLEDRGFGDVLADLLASFPLVGSQRERNAFVRSVLSDRTNPLRGELCRALIKLWYLGIWYPPQILGPSSDTSFGWGRWVASSREVITPQTYKEALVWKLMQAHPMAYSNFQFGYWAEDPPPLPRFMTFVPDE